MERGRESGGGDLSDETLPPVDGVGADELAGAAGAVENGDHVQQVEGVGKQERITDIRESEEYAVINRRIA